MSWIGFKKQPLFLREFANLSTVSINQNQWIKNLNQIYLNSHLFSEFIIIIIVTNVTLIDHTQIENKKMNPLCHPFLTSYLYFSHSFLLLLHLWIHDTKNFATLGKMVNPIFWLGARVKRISMMWERLKIRGNIGGKKCKGMARTKKLGRPKDMSIIVAYFEMLLHPERHGILSVSASS